jgi:GTP:adenosylcobinamide-phosphate guanylyltransferase
MFNAIVLAGEREKALQNSDLLAYANAKLKSLILIKNKPMIMYVLDTLLDHPMINKIYVIGPATLIEHCSYLQELTDAKKVVFKEQLESPVNSILSVINEISESEKIFITTSDNVLIKKEWVDFFLNSAIDGNKDIVMGVNDYKSVLSKYPESKRTVLKFRDISFCFCNLFAINSNQGRKLIEMWKKVENLRKKPFKIATMLMPIWGLFLFACGLLTSKKGVKMMSKRLNTNIDFIVLPYPEACIDVDKVEDLILVKKILNA